jgi:hypothetical protein
MVLPFFAEGIRQAREPAISHARAEITAFDDASEKCAQDRVLSASAEVSLALVEIGVSAGAFYRSWI